MYQECFKLVKKLNSEKLDILEISAGNVWQSLAAKTFTAANLSGLDIFSLTLPNRFDLVIADQFFEHLLWPYRATKNVYEMLRSEGYFLITMPFLIKVHKAPVDCSKWSELGFKHLLSEGGFPIEKIQTGSWSNKACVKGSVEKWAQHGWFNSLNNEPDFPVSVWAIAQK